MKRIAVKIGSNVLTRKDGTLDITRMSALVDQVADLHRQGMEIVLISSGAVASGRSEIKAGKKLDPVSARQLYSAVGQAKLINRYYELFREHGMTCGQVLTTKENFGSRTHYLNQKHCMEVMLENKVIPIVNENDTISVTELMFTDNDELSGLIATMMGMDALVILSNIDGIYNGNPSDPDSSVIREIECGKTDLSEYVQTSKSSFGRGGMLTKCHIAQKVADEGIAVIIANGKKVMLENKVIPIVNENDTISVTELMFTDNDELSGLIATMMGMDALVILSNIDGIYNGNPSDPDSSVIREIECGKTDLSEYVQTSKSSFGRGGMLTKCHIAQKVADEGIAVIIANGKKDNILPMLLAVDSDTVCTRFIPASKPVSSVKKWIAHSEGFAKGEIHINKGAEKALTAPKATSVLLVGVTRIEGDFEKDDIVKIMNEEGVQIGVGCTAYDSEEARKQIGQRDLKPLIHYDYLYLD